MKEPNLRQKLDQRMDQLQIMMEDDMHLYDPEGVIAHIDSITFAWSVLSEEDRDYVQASQWAIDEQLPWGNIS